MHNHLSEARVESKLIPGVVFVIHAPSYGRRLMLDRATAEFRSLTRLMQKRYDKIVDRIKGLQAEHHANFKAQESALEKEVKASEGNEEHERLTAELATLRGGAFKVPTELTDELTEINEESLYLLAAKYNAPRVRHYLKAIEGYEIDGVAATIETLISDGAPQVVTEVLEAIDSVEKMKADEIKNLSSPSTSSSPAAGETKDTTATIAESSDTTKPATA